MKHSSSFREIVYEESPREARKLTASTGFAGGSFASLRMTVRAALDHYEQSCQIPPPALTLKIPFGPTRYNGSEHSFILAPLQ